MTQEEGKLITQKAAQLCQEVFGYVVLAWNEDLPSPSVITNMAGNIGEPIRIIGETTKEDWKNQMNYMRNINPDLHYPNPDEYTRFFKAVAE